MSTDERFPPRHEPAREACAAEPSDEVCTPLVLVAERRILLIGLEVRTAGPGRINHALAQIVASLNVAAAVALPPAVRFW